MGRTLSAKQVLTLKRRTIRPGGIWADCVGEIDRTGVVFFWGNSGNGKTSAVASFCKELTQFGRVLYLPLEEGLGGTTQDAIRRCRLDECGRKFQYNATMTFSEMDEALSKPRSWDFVVIDSFQYTQMSYKEYIAFKERHRNKLLIFVSHADGKRPEGRAAMKIMYDASLKIWVEGHKAFSKGRYIGPKGECTIYEKEAKRYWEGKTLNRK